MADIEVLQCATSHVLYKGGAIDHRKLMESDIKRQLANYMIDNSYELPIQFKETEGGNEVITLKLKAYLISEERLMQLLLCEAENIRNNAERNYPST